MESIFVKYKYIFFHRQVYGIFCNASLFFLDYLSVKYGALIGGYLYVNKLFNINVFLIFLFSVAVSNAMVIFCYFLESVLVLVDGPLLFDF